MPQPPFPIHPVSPAIDVVLTDSPFEQGLQQGRGFADRIGAAGDVVKRLEAFDLLRPGWMPRVVFAWLARRKAYRGLREVLPVAAPAQWERLRGIAEGSGVPLDHVCLLNALEPVLSDLTNSVTHGLNAGCSAIAVGADRTTARGPVVAHNFDYLPIIQPFYVLRDERPAEGLRSLVFSVAPLAGVVDGINEAGLAVSYNYAYATDGGEPAVPLSMRLQEMLARCRNVGAAVAFLTSQPRWGGGLLMLADAEGAIVSLELTHRHHAVREGRPNAILTHSNRFCCGPTTEHEIDAEAVYGSNSPAALRSQPVHRSSNRRNARLRELTEAAASLDLPGIATLMSDHGPDNAASADTICMHSSYWHTTATLQLLPAERRMRVAYAPTCAAKYVDFTIE
ncbi:MAG: C45 family peptidase [Planctomycetaceae bacterium]